ncbi:MAG: 4Fe-4S binding protein [Thermodesulfobacteriota bacterium]|nr:4Fe-4S binding protein [Thermodesulfobacteriota bacterium]
MRLWFSYISKKQKIWLFGTLGVMFCIVGFGIFLDSLEKTAPVGPFTIDMSIRDIAPHLKVTGKALARELKLPIDIKKAQPLKNFGVAQESLDHVVSHLLSHREKTVKYYLYGALVLGGLVFLVRLGCPDGSDVKQRHMWYPRTPYVVFLIISVSACGFLMGKSPNPMEGVVKVFKSMVGLYPDPLLKGVAFLFFMLLAVAGNKMVCGWACPFGSLQELIYSIPMFSQIKQRRPPFIVTNILRILIFLAMVLFLFGIVGGRKGTVIYHYINPFNLFNLDFETVSIVLTVAVTLFVSFVFYRPFCQLLCPFGLVSWIVERFSLCKVHIDMQKCTHCSACIRSCPLQAAQDRMKAKEFPADCFSCGRCLNVCPVDAIRYRSFLSKKA